MENYWDALQVLPVYSWNSVKLAFLNSRELQTVPVALALFQGEFFSNVPGLMVAATIVIVPAFVAFVIAPSRAHRLPDRQCRRRVAGGLPSGT